MRRDPYVAVRDFRVWFDKRRGFLEALRRAEPDHIRAVDNVDLDIGRGEIFCLVGESGCGKTTTGKGILRLVEPSGGDVFVGLPADVLSEYEAVRAKGDEPAAEEIRRKHSLAWKPRRAWSLLDLLILGSIIGGAFLLVASLSAGLSALLFGLPLSSDPSLFAMGIGLGLSFGALGCLPPARPVPRTAAVLALLSPVLFNLGLYLGLLFEGSPDPGARFGTAYWGDQTLPMIGGSLAALAAAAVGARVLLSIRIQSEGLEGPKIRTLRRKLQIIFQDPYESLNPKHSVFDIVAEPLVVNRLSGNRAETEARVEQALHDAGLRPPRDFLFRYPHELSGGQRQRVSIAGALVLDPEFLVADEPVSMLDVSIRTEILELLLELRKKKGLTYLFITHDLSLAWVLADRIGVMYLGKIVEEGPPQELIKNPRHPYTKALVSVVPVPDPDRRRKRIILKGERPDPSDIPPGCRFHPRCPVAFERCGWTSEEVLEELSGLMKTESVENPLAKAHRDGDHAFFLPGASAALASTIRGLVESRSDEIRALKAIRTVEADDGGLRVTLHDFAEPTLKVVIPEVKVSCHLFP